MGRHFDIAPKKSGTGVRQKRASVSLVSSFVVPKSRPAGNFAPRGRSSSLLSYGGPFLESVLLVFRDASRAACLLFKSEGVFSRLLRPFCLRWTVRRYRARVMLRNISARYALLGHPASPLRMLRPSRLALLFAVVLGMATTHFVERLINGSASADTATEVAGVSTEHVPGDISSAELFALANEGGGDEKPFEIEILSQFIDEEKQDKFEAEVHRMVAGYPIESMLPFIFEKDRITATFLIGIAKKESNWGRRVPVLDGQDCYNYWGFRERRRLMGTGGHTCFNGKKDAVDSVSKRIENLIYEYERNTPEKMIIWKCGYSCAGHSPESVRKWISDVEGYYNALNDAERE